MPKKVCISIITTTNIRVETAQWLLRTFSQLRENCYIDFITDKKGIQDARNRQVVNFLQTDCTYLYTLDSDCVPQNNTIEKLLAYDLDIISSPHACMINGEGGVMAVDKVKDGYIQHKPMEGLQEVDAVGGSGMLIKREVFNNIDKPCFKSLHNEDGYLMLTEDFYFCENLKRNGYKIYADFNLVQSHVIGVVL